MTPAGALGLVLALAGTARGAELAVPEGSELQAALDRAQPGDTIVLEAGASYAGPFVLPRKLGDGWIIVRGPRAAEPGRRVQPADARGMPKLVAAHDSIVIAAPGAHHYRLEGLELRPTSGVFLYDLVQLGDTATATADLPHDLVIAGCYLHGDAELGSRRGIALNSAATMIVDSYLADFKERGADSQAIAGWSGPGPFVIANSYLEAAGENVMFGGADPPGADRIPSDIAIRGNYFSKPLSWQREAWTVKNLLELKDARRVVIEGNVLEHAWPAAQNGFAVLFTVRDQDGTAPWTTVEDVVFRGNVVRACAAGVNILGHDDGHPRDRGQAKRIAIRDDVFVDIPGTLFQLLDATADVTIEHNTALHSGSVIVADGRPHTGFVFRANVVRHNAYGIVGSGTSPGMPTFAKYFPGARVTGNVIAGARAAAYPAGNFFPRALDGVVVRDGDLVRLADHAVYRDVGADPAVVRRALAAAPARP